jgi:hypothetical protein
VSDPSNIPIGIEAVGAAQKPIEPISFGTPSSEPLGPSPSDDVTTWAQNYMNMSPDKLLAEQEINVSHLIGGQLGISPRAVLADIPRYAQRFVNSKEPKLSDLDAIARHFEIGRLSTDKSYAWFDKFLGESTGNVEQALAADERIKEISSKIPNPDKQMRGWGTELFKMVSENLPYLLDTAIVGGAVGTAMKLGGSAILGTAFKVYGSRFAQVANYMATTAPTAAVSFSLMTGMQYEDLMNITGKNGEKIDPERARQIAAVSGFFQALVEADAVSGLLGGKSIAQQVIKKAFFKSYLGGTAAGLATEWLTATGSQTGEEVIQQIIQIYARDFAVIAENAKRDKDLGPQINQTFDRQTAESMAQELGQTFIQSLQVMGVLSVPGTIARFGGIRQEVKKDIATAAINTFISTPTPDPIALSVEADQINKKIEAGTVTVDEIKRFKEISTELDTIETKAAEPIPVPIEEIQQTPHQLTRAEWITQAAPQGEPAITIPDDLRRNLEATPFRQLAIDNLPNLNPQQVDAFVLAHDLRAQAEGKSLDTFIEEIYRPGVFGTVEQGSEIFNQENRKAAVQFYEDGKALLFMSKASDFSSAIHEPLHVFRRRLPTADQATLENHYEVKDGKWETAHEERFVKDAENFLMEGKAPTPELEPLFQRIAEWLRRVYAAIRGRWELHPEVKAVMERIFSKQQAAPATTTGPLELYQTAEKTDTPEFKKWFGNSKVVDKDGNPIVVYHGTDKNFRRFDTKKTTQGIIWVTSNKSDIEAGEVGAQGRGIILELYASIQNPAGWEEYNKYGLGELKQKGYDGAILPEGQDITAFVFEPTQLKSIKNAGEWNANNPALLHQEDEHYQDTKRAVESGEWVSSEVLADYKSEEWAQAEIESRKSLMEDARTYSSVDEFVEVNSNLEIGEPHTEEYYANIYAEAHMDERAGRDEANARFVEDMTPAKLEAVLASLADADALEGQHKGLVLAAKTVLKGNHLSDAQYKKLMDQIRHDPAYYRELIAGALGDEDEIRALEAEAAKDPTGTELERMKRENSTLRKNIESMKGKVEDIAQQAELASKVAKDFETKAQGLEDALISAREEAAKGDTVASTEARALLTDARKEAALQARAVAQDAKAKVRELIAVKQYAQKLIGQIMKKPSAAIDYTYAKKIKDIQSVFELKTPAKLQAFREKITGMLFDSRFEHLKADLEKMLEKQNIRKKTIAELEAIAAGINRLRTEGRDARFEKLSKIKERQSGIRGDIKQVLDESGKYKKPPVVGSEEYKKQNKGIGQAVKGFDLALTTIHRVATILDGGKEDGIFTRILVKGERAAHRKQFDAADKRLNIIQTEMKSLGLDFDHFYKETVSIEGTTLSKSDILGMYIGMRDESTKAHIIYGNLIDENQRKSLSPEQLQALGNARMRLVEQFISKLTDKEKQAANLFIKDADVNFARFEAAIIEHENRAPPKVDVYMPNEVKERTGEALEYNFKQDMLTSYGLKRNVDKGATLERIKINPKNQMAINLDAIGVYLRGIEKQERYIAYSGFMKDANATLRDGRSASLVRHFIKNTHGQKYLDYVDNWLSGVANPKAYDRLNQMTSGLDKAFNMLRGPVSVAYLGLRISSAFKQFITNPIPYIPYAGPRMFWGMLKNLNPIEMRKDLAFAKEKSALVRHRTQNQAVEAVKNWDLGSRWNRARDATMTLLEGSDLFAVGTGWKAIYDMTYAESLKTMTEAEADTVAVDKADEITIKTQPTAREADLAPAFKSKNAFAKIVTQFQNPMNVIYNQVFHDLPDAVRNQRWGEVAGILPGYLLVGGILGLLAAPRDTDDDEEAQARAMIAGALKQPLDAILIIGPALDPILDQIVTGKKVYHSNQTAFPGLEKIINGLSNLPDLEDSDKVLKTAQGLAEGAGIVVGLPTSALKEYYRVLFEGDIAALIGRPKEKP